MPSAAAVSQTVVAAAIALLLGQADANGVMGHAEQLAGPCAEFGCGSLVDVLRGAVLLNLTRGASVIYMCGLLSGRTRHCRVLEKVVGAWVTTPRGRLGVLKLR